MSARGPNAGLAAFLALAAATLFWTGNFTVGRAVSGEIAPATLNFLRWALSIAVLTPVAAPLLARQWRLARRDAAWIAALGATGVAAFQTLVYYGVAATPVLNAVLIIAATPALIIIIEAIRSGRPPSALQALGAAASLAGATVLVVRGDFSRLSAMAFGPGDGFMIAAAIVWAIYTMLLRAHPKDTSPTVVLYGSMIAGALMMAPLAIPEMLARPPDLTRWEILAAIGYVAVFASLLAFALWTYGVRRIGPVRAGLFLNFMPVWAAILGFALLGERVAQYHVAGAALVLLGVVLVNWRALRGA